METLLAAYAIAWAAVTAYVVWLAVGNGRLARRLERLETLQRGYRPSAVSYRPETFANHSSRKPIAESR